MTPHQRQRTLELLRSHLVPVSALDVGPVLAQVGEASIVLLGEATAGTREFYRLRVEITQRLITEFDFDAIALDADWTDALRVSRYVQGGRQDIDAVDSSPDAALRGFAHFPRWAWRNGEFASLVEWLHAYNQGLPEDALRIGVYGLDLFRRHASLDSVLHAIEDSHPASARRAHERAAQWDHVAPDAAAGGRDRWPLVFDDSEALVQQLCLAQAEIDPWLHADEVAAADERFYLEQQERAARAAERHYRALLDAPMPFWNQHDRQLAMTLDALRAFLSAERDRPAKLIVWAHNLRIGDARATALGDRGAMNFGQLARQRFGRRHVSLLGFTSHRGTVTAATGWDAAPQTMTVPESRDDSIEHLLHDCGEPDFMLPMPPVAHALDTPLLQRAIGAVYRPHSERVSHVFSARLAAQFDAVIHLDETAAVRPLDEPTEAPQPAEATFTSAP